jgi:hypothetical protein
MHTRFPFHEFNGPLHRQWKYDRAIRQRIPISQSWRGCLGLAMMWRDVDADFECVGNDVFYGNDNLTWLCLRDIPPGHFPGNPLMDRRDVNPAGTATATLVHGKPRLDFSASAQTWDFRRMPYNVVNVGRNGRRIETRVACADTLNTDERPREFAIFNRLSAAMTEQAFCGCNHYGRWKRPAWATTRRTSKPVPFTPPADWFPRPYVGFRSGDVAGVLQGQEMNAGVESGERISRELVTLAIRPELTFCPMLVAAMAFSSILPVDLVWNCAVAEPFVDPDLSAAIFPPLSLRRWDYLRFNLFDVDVNAGVSDPRFDASTSPLQISNAQSRRSLAVPA